MQYFREIKVGRMTGILKVSSDADISAIDTSNRPPQSKTIMRWLCIILGAYVLYALILGPLYFVIFYFSGKMSLDELRTVLWLLKPIVIVFPEESVIGDYYLNHYIAWWMELAQ